MNIIIYLEDSSFSWMADAACTSALRWMPDAQVKIVGTPPCEADRNFLGRYALANAEACIPGAENLHINADVLFNASVAGVFDREFDLALVHIASPDVRYDGAVVFARNPTFWRLLASMRECFGPERHVTEQLLAIELAARGCAAIQDVIELPGRMFSYVPTEFLDPHASRALVTHYRGDRKQWMAKVVGVPHDEAERYKATRAATHPGIVPKRSAS